MARHNIRTRVFIGCEGASERSYIRWIQDLANERGLGLHLDAQIANGGDPLAIVQVSAKTLKKRQRAHGKYQASAVLLDSDRLGVSPQRDQQIASVAERSGLEVIWQEYDHEALLLRHFDGCRTLRPPRGQSQARLRQEWPQYSKPADATSLGERFQLSDLIEVFAVEPELRAFFARLGFAL